MSCQRESALFSLGQRQRNSAFLCAQLSTYFIRALHPRVQIILAHNGAYPTEVPGTGAQRAVRSRPVGLAVHIGVASAIQVLLASSVTRAKILALSPFPVPPVLVVHNLSPRFCNVCRRTGRHRSWLSTRLR